MTEYLMHTTKEEADDIERGKPFVIRSTKVNKGDILRFGIIKNQRTVMHRISKNRYIVTYVASWDNAPVTDGLYIVGFQPCKK